MEPYLVEMNASRTSSRGKNTSSTSPLGCSVGMSLVECTAMSISPRSMASSISLVNRPFVADFLQRAIRGNHLAIISGGLDHLDMKRCFGQVKRGHQPIPGVS